MMPLEKPTSPESRSYRSTVLTVPRASSEPARARACTWLTMAGAWRGRQSSQRNLSRMALALAKRRAEVASLQPKAAKMVNLMPHDEPMEGKRAVFQSADSREV